MVEINGGALSAALDIDLGNLETDLKKAMIQATDQAKVFESALKKAAISGGQSLKAFFGDAVKTGEQLGTLIEKGLSGIDPSKLEGLTNRLEGANDEFQLMKELLDFIQANLSEFNLSTQEIEQLSAGVSQLQSVFTGTAEKQKTVVAQLREIRSALATQDKGSDGFEQLLGDARELEEKIKGVKTELKLAGDNSAGLTVAGQAVRGLIGGFTALQGAIALASGENKDLDRTLNSLVASMAILQGLSEFMAVLDKNSALNTFLLAKNRKAAALATGEQALATTALAASTGAQAVATEAAAVAQTGLNAAMLANPAGLLIGALTAIVVAVQYFSSSVRDATEDQIALNKALLEIGDRANTIREKLLNVSPYQQEIRELEKRSAALKAAGASQLEILQIEEQISERRKQIAFQTFRIWNNETQAYDSNLEAFKAANKERLDEIVSMESQLNALDKKLAGVPDSESGFYNPFSSGSGKSKLEKERQLLKSKYDLNLKYYTDNEKAIQEFESFQIAAQEARLERERYLLEQSLKSSVAYWEAQTLLAIKGSEEARTAEEKALRARTRQALANPDITGGEIVRIKEQEKLELRELDRKYNLIRLNDEREVIKARLTQVKEASISELNLKIDLINKNAEYELAAAEITQAETDRIKAEAAKEIFQLRKDFNQRLIREDIEIEIAGISARLAAVREGTQEELAIRLELSEEQEKLSLARAQAEIKNEELLAATLKRIAADSLAERRKLQEDYVDKFLQKQFEKIDRESLALNDPLDRVISNPRSSSTEKYNSQLQKLNNELEAFRRKQIEVANEIIKGTGNVERLTKAYEDLQRAIDKTNEEKDQLVDNRLSKILSSASNDLQDIAGALGQLAASIDDVNAGLADTLQTLSDVTSAAGDVAGALSSFLSGDIVGAITKTVSAIAKVFTIGKRVRESERKTQEEIREFYAQIQAGELAITQQYRERAREIVKLNKLRIQGLLDEKALLDQQKAAAKSQYDLILRQLQQELFVAGKVQEKYGGFLGIGRKSRSVEIYQTLAGKSFEEIERLFNEGRLNGKAKELFELLQKIQQEGGDIDSLLAENAQTFKEAITGTNTDNLASSIIEGFKQGLRSATDFANTFQELMQNALLQSLQLRYLEGPLSDFFEQFAGLAESDGQLTNAEIANLQNQYNQILENAAAQFDQLQQVAGVNLAGQSGQNNSLQGAIKGITEDQANLLAGQFGGLRLTAIELLNVSRQHLTAANQIQLNTANTVMELKRQTEKLIYYFDTVGVKIR